MFFDGEPGYLSRCSNGLEDWGSIPGREINFSDLHYVQTNSGVHSASYQMCMGGFFHGVKPLKRETDNSSFSAGVKNSRAIPSILHTPSRRRG
jgi:hypothetical protein